MRVILIFICTLIISTNSFSQIKHIFSNVIVPPPGGPTSLQNNRWYKSINAGNVIHIQFFNENPVGVKKAIDLVKEICLNNDFDFENPNKDNSYFASYVKSIEDYENMNLSIKVGDSIIEKIWHNQGSNGKTSMLRISLDEKGYNVSVTNPK